MALSIKLKDGLGISYELKVETVEHLGSRAPTQAGVPGGDVVFIDLGVTLEQITIAGVIDQDTTPTKDQLRTACREWYANYEASDVIMEVEGEEYSGGVKNFTFRKEAAKEDRWSFSISFAVKEKL